MIGSAPAAAFTRSIFSFSMTSGMMRVPASLSPFFTGKSPWRVAIIICPKELTASSFSLFMRRTPSISEQSSILPSFTSPRLMFSPLQIEQSTSAASFSCIMLSSFSQTYILSLPTESSTGMSSSVIMCPLRKTASLVTPFIICVMSWQMTCPTASSVFISFMI